MNIRNSIISAIALLIGFVASAQTEMAMPDSVATKTETTSTEATPLPVAFFLPAVFDGYRLFEPIDTAALLTQKSDLPECADWLYRQNRQADFLARIKQNYLINNAKDVVYVASTMKRPQKKFDGKVDPKKRKVEVNVDNVDLSELSTDLNVEMKRRNWLHDFNGSLQFSQAYISPNWYQGGNNNLNAILFVYYNVKLNQNFYPNLLFDTTVQYKLSANNAPTDSIHDINISEDQFQFNTKFGVKAFKKWFYSIAVDFKTPLLQNFKPNQHVLSAALMSPGELNVGVGMTYNHVNKDKTFTADVSLAPFSYNLKTCLSPNINPADFGIDPPHKTANQFGSSGELKIKWNVVKNLTYYSRVFIFTNYDYIQSDWENTLEFTFNRFLSTRIFAHLRYDSSVPPLEGSKWKRWQFKEVLSFGLAYKFSTKAK